MAREQHVLLRNGVSMPLLGLGTSHNEGGYVHDTAVFAIRECGYRLLDTAQRYGCETQLGEAIVESGVDRRDMFITDKLWPGYYGYNSALEQTRRSLEKLNTEYLDLYLLHWPGARDQEQLGTTST